MRRRWQLVALPVLAILALSACSSSSSGAGAGTSKSGTNGKQLNIAIITDAYGTPAAKQAMDLFTKEGESRGWKVTIQSSTDFSQINSYYQNAASQKVDAIVNGFDTIAQVGAGMAVAKTAGVPVFGLDTSTVATPGFAFIGTSNNSFLGEASASELVKQIGGKGSVVMIGYDQHAGIKLRTSAAKKYFQDHGIKIVTFQQVRGPQTGTEDALNYVQDAFSANPGKDTIQGVWCGFDAAGFGAVQAIEKSGRLNVKVTAVDATDQGLALIKKGSPFVGSVKQDWAVIDKNIADAIQKVVAGGQPAEAITYTPGVIINKDNVDKYYTGSK